MKQEQREYYETSAYKIQTSGNYPEERIQYTEHGERLKSGIFCRLLVINMLGNYTYFFFLSTNHKEHGTLYFVFGT